MYKTAPRRKNQPLKRDGSFGFPDGLNTLAHPSSLKNSELSELINGVYSQYGSLSKRLGTIITGQSATAATKILNSEATYDVGGTDRWIRISDNGKPEVYNFSTRQWGLLTGTAPDGYTGDSPAFTDGTPTFNTTVITNIVQLDNRIFFSNTEDQLVYLDNDGTWKVYVPLADPTTKPTVAKTGAATGSATFYYYYVWYNQAGGTLSSAPADRDTDANGTGHRRDMPIDLDDDTFLTLTLPAAPAGTTRVGIFRSNKQGVGFFLDSVEPSQTTYVDKGQLGTDTFGPLPETNDTGGQQFRLLETYQGKLIGVSKQYGDDHLVWSGDLQSGIPGDTDSATSFAITDGAGFTPYRRGEGTKINAIKTHVASSESSVFVFKDNVFGKFVIDEVGGRVQDVNIAVGSLSRFSPHIAGNNLRFWSRDGAATVGNEENYGNLLRYSVLSLRADAITQQVTAANLPDVCGTYFKHLSIFGISTELQGGGNNSCLVYDERYNAWTLWTGIYARMFVKVISPVDKVERLYYASNKTADMVEMFRGKTDYGTTGQNGSKVTLSITTKQYDMGASDQFKKFDKATIVFGELFGDDTTISVTRMDDRELRVEPRLAITTDPILSGFGTEEWGDAEFGVIEGSNTSSQVKLRFIDLRQRDLLWVKLNIQNDGLADEVSILGIFFYYSISDKPLSHRLRIRKLASN